NENPQVKRVEIQGHTDSSGESDANQVLSQERADAVRLYLLDAGVDGDRLIAKGYGDSQPVESDGADGVEPMNRRVEFVITEFDVDTDAEEVDADTDGSAAMDEGTAPGVNEDPAAPADAPDDGEEETP
ncbi:MAG: OmpA family protein, partial [Myxococcota bacterium]